MTRVDDHAMSTTAPDVALDFFVELRSSAANIFSEF
jgi:hypothetical protein